MSEHRCRCIGAPKGSLYSHNYTGVERASDLHLGCLPAAEHLEAKAWLHSASAATPLLRCSQGDPPLSQPTDASLRIIAAVYSVSLRNCKLVQSPTFCSVEVHFAVTLYQVFWQSLLQGEAAAAV